MEALIASSRELELGPVALVTHDWGVLSGCAGHAITRAR